MHSEISESNSNKASVCYLARLSAEDAAALEPLEDQVHLTFWGIDNYRRFLEEMPEYFGCKAVLPKNGNDGSLAGFYLARSVFDNLEILKLGVTPDCQRMGIGTRLMEACYLEGMRRGCTRCFLEVRKSNQKAIQFYHAQVFKIVGSRHNYYNHPVEDAWIMERAL